MSLVIPAPVPVTVPITGGGRFPVRRIYCVGRNYVEHAQEMGFSGREPPFFFLKPADAVVVVPEGQTGAIQASNQLLGVTASQLAEIHALLIAQGRALETERMERLAREERAREIQRRAFPTETTRSTEPARTAF